MPQRTDLVVLSPRAYEPDAFHHSPAGYKRLLVHEAVHMVEEYLSPNIEALPRWWSEGLATYLSGQWKAEDRERAEVVQGIQAGVIPALAEMRGGAGASDRAVELCYVWGWTVVEFIEVGYGRDMVRRVVEECDDGDVFRILGESAQAFESKWRHWLLGRKRGIGSR